MIKQHSIGNFIINNANTVAEYISDVVETTGNFVTEAFYFVVRDIPVLSHILNWLGSVISGFTDFVAVVIKSLFGLVGGGTGHILNVIIDILTFKGTQILKGLGNILSSVMGTVFLIFLSVMSFVQQIIPWVQAKERRMTDDEIKDMKRIFGGSLAFYNIRIVEGKRAGFFSFSDRELVVGNTIFMKNHNPMHEPERLTHELVHVWQYHKFGARYTFDALYAQLIHYDAYNWKQEILNGHSRWSEFNIEAQASFIQDVYLKGKLDVISGVKHHKGEFFNSVEKKNNSFIDHDYTILANEAWEKLKGSHSHRVSFMIC